jgi:hypothetical protein
LFYALRTAKEQTGVKKNNKGDRKRTECKENTRKSEEKLREAEDEEAQEEEEREKKGRGLWLCEALDDGFRLRIVDIIFSFEER